MIGESNVIKYENCKDAVDAFHALYLEQTGNAFDAQIFEKKPGKYQVLDINHDKREQVLQSLVETKLEPPLYDLMKLICDEKAMKDTMLKFNLDTDRLPLGKISKKQIEVASKILNEISVLLENNGDYAQFIEASNRFYTMIPHSFGINAPPVINSKEMIDSKIEMLKRLTEIEFTYSLLSETDDKKNPLDGLYEKINAEISPMSQDSDEYRQINEYFLGTSESAGCDCDCYQHKLVVKEMFKVVRSGEDERFKTFSPQISNRRLLWHGSSLTNFVGILSNGLKIAPPEAEATGENLGKGIYFADMVSKSSAYCETEEDFGLILLCEVELGGILEVNNPNSDIKSRLGGNNSVKGCGNEYPSSINIQGDGLQIPAGPIQYGDNSFHFDFNEYAVYNEAQVKIRYLVKTEQSCNYDDDGECDDSDCCCCC